MNKNFIIKKNQETLRLDKWLKINFSSLNQSFIEKNIRKKNIIVNETKTKASYRLVYRDKVTIINFNKDNYKHFTKVVKLKNIPQKIHNLFKLSVIYENENFLVFNKWSGIASQSGTKINISIDDIIKNISISYNLVHRLDKETSGLMIIAKNLEYTKIFGNMFKNKKIEKNYIAICQGKPKVHESISNLEIEDKKNFHLKLKTETYYKVLDIKDNLSSILFIPKTGKTHQLRILSKNLGCPIIGDQKYNSQEKYKNENLKLNANSLKFKIKNKNYEFNSSLPNHFKFFLKKTKLKILY